VNEDEAQAILRSELDKYRASIDDGGCRAFFPLSDCFIKAPDGSLVGEN